jgi:hypothetical protein
MDPLCATGGQSSPPFARYAPWSTAIENLINGGHATFLATALPKSSAILIQERATAFLFDPACLIASHLNRNCIRTRDTLHLTSFETWRGDAPRAVLTPKTHRANIKRVFQNPSPQEIAPCQMEMLCGKASRVRDGARTSEVLLEEGELVTISTQEAVEDFGRR